MTAKPVPIHGTCAPGFERVREAFAENFSVRGDVGAAANIVVDGRSVVDLWGGWVDRERSAEWQRDTLVNVFSTTKGITTICAHQLVERGALDLDEPVATYWPEFAAAGKGDLPVRWLLCHKAGLPALREPLPREALYDWSQMTAALAAEVPWWEPGTKHGYHALTFGFLVGEVIRRVSGQSVGTFFREHVAGPLDADFHIGLAPAHDARTANTIGSLKVPKSSPSLKIEGPLGKFLREMADPSTMAGATFSNPRQRRGEVNTREWRAAEIPAVNGHGTARSIARIYSALARGGEVDGVRVLTPESIERATTEQAFGPDAVLGGIKMRFGLGFALRHPGMPLSPGPAGFGHAGAGGSLGCADPENRVGFGYTMNRMQAGLGGGPGAYALLEALYESLA